MKALHFDGELRLGEFPRPEPREGEALIRVLVAGICNTDIEITRGYFQFRGILGHEFVGQVVEAPGAPEWIGRRVVGEINLGCGECQYCRRGLRRHCPNRTVLGILGKDGCLAEYVTLPVENLWSVPEHLPDEVAVFTEPLAASLEILECTQVRPSDRVLVVGDGKLGLLVVQVLRLAGCELAVIGRHRNKLALARDFGADVLPTDAAPRAEFDVVVEASGAPGGWETAIGAVRPRGTVVLKSTYAEVPRIDLAPVVVNEVKIVGSRCGPFDAALRLLDGGLVRTTELVSETLLLEEGVKAFSLAQQPETLKVLLTNR